MTYPLVRQPPLSRAARKTATREAIIDAAAWLFARRGIEATSLDAIATRVGLTKGAVYGNFSSKRELIEAVASAKSAHLDIRPLLRRDLPLDARLSLFARQSVTLLRGVSRQVFLLDFEYQVYAKRNRSWGEHMRLHLRRYIAGIVLEFEAVNRERGETLPMPAAEFFDALITVSRGVAHQLALDPDAISAETVEKLFVQLGLVCQ
ncbi:MAG TPA: helix-turn-helix domain-containing protein [Gemmatimonadaceae bacterium]|nr:helix-turn-helix domain-containing protein [Gemmatimonadaceae bacterium]